MNEKLVQLADRLEELEYPSYLVPMNEEESIHQLVVDIDEELALRMTIFFLGDLLKLVAGQKEISDISTELEESKADFLQLFVRFPFELQKETTPDTARLALMFNWSTPVGAFGLNEAQNFVFYRHVFQTTQDEPTDELIIEAVAGMDFYAKQRFEGLRAISTGEKSLNEYIQEIEKSNRKSEEFPGYDL